MPGLSVQVTADSQQSNSFSAQEQQFAPLLADRSADGTDFKVDYQVHHGDTGITIWCARWARACPGS